MKTPNENPTVKNNSLAWILTMLIALAAGGVGGYFSYSYFTSPGLSILNEITPDLMNRTRPIIQEAKKVVVEQNDQTQNVANNLSKNLLAISLKQDKPATDWQKTYYDPSQRVGEALPLTSDGWLVTNFNQLNDDLGRSAKKYVVISHDGVIHEIDRVVKDNFTNTTFIKITSRNLPVSKLAGSPHGKNGNILVGASFNGDTDNFYQVNSQTGETSTIKSSDNRNQEIKLSQSAKNYLALVNLAGEIEAYVSPSGIFSAGTINRDFASLLKYGQIKRPLLGFYYLNIGSLATIKTDINDIKNGILLYTDNTHAWPKNSPALSAGLKPNDLITAINNNELNRDNKDALLELQPGDTAKLTVNRLGKTLEVNIKIGELK